MQRPQLLIFSAESDLVAELCDLLHERVEIDVCTLPDDIRTLARQSPPALFLGDFRGSLDGGHFADRLLEELQVEHDQMHIVMLTDSNCPEPLERRAACSPVTHLRGIPDVGELVKLIENDILVAGRDTWTAEAVSSPKSAARGDEREPETVLQGVTRRFETRAPQLRRMLEDLAIAAAHNVTILLIGETGSGKTFLSNLIHEASPRKLQPFIHVACGALPRELIESELFGHVKGSFTSAHADKDGKFIAAGRGTILLDEIDVLGPEQQVKLLRVIETGEFEQVGSNRTLKSQARLVVASNLDLQPLVEQGKFRPDLYYRLNMLKFDIPPLRQRKVDITPLARRFVEKFAQQHGVPVHRIDDTLMSALIAYPWPGNVRELEHVIQRAVIYCRDGILTESNLPSHIINGRVGPTNDPSIRLSRIEEHDPSLGQQIALTERDIIEQALLRNSFSRTQTARELGISRVTLYNKMKKYEMLR
ncbi:MAG: sigma-54 dependent transcriptional regulator [Planctomycetaceae bacterium]